MQVKDIVETVYGEKVEIKEIKSTFAVVYQLDEHGKRFPRYRAKGFIEGRLTLKQ